MKRLSKICFYTGIYISITACNPVWYYYFTILVIICLTLQIFFIQPQFWSRNSSVLHILEGGESLPLWGLFLLLFTLVHGSLARQMPRILWLQSLMALIWWNTISQSKGFPLKAAAFQASLRGEISFRAIKYLKPLIVEIAVSRCFIIRQRGLDSLTAFYQLEGSDMGGRIYSLFSNFCKFSGWTVHTWSIYLAWR